MFSRRCVGVYARSLSLSRVVGVASRSFAAPRGPPRPTKEEEGAAATTIAQLTSELWTARGELSRLRAAPQQQQQQAAPVAVDGGDSSASTALLTTQVV
jgi:hypothetical protein